MADLVDPREVLTADELMAALDAAEDMWRALAADDDVGAEAILMPELREVFGQGGGIHLLPCAALRDPHSGGARCETSPFGSAWRC